IAADTKRDRIVFAVADIREADSAYNCSVESTRGPESVDPQCIVSTVFSCPFAVINKTRRNLLQCKINHRIRRNYHRIRAGLEFIDNAGNYFSARREVVCVELYGVPPASFKVDCFIPTPAYAKIPALRNQMNKAWVRDAAQKLRRAVR